MQWPRLAFSAQALPNSNCCCKNPTRTQWLTPKRLNKRRHGACARGATVTSPRRRSSWRRRLAVPPGTGGPRTLASRGKGCGPCASQRQTRPKKHVAYREQAGHKKAFKSSPQRLAEWKPLAVLQRRCGCVPLAPTAAGYVSSRCVARP